MPFHAKGRGLLRKMDTTSKVAPLARGAPLPETPLPVTRQTGGFDLRGFSPLAVP